MFLVHEAVHIMIFCAPSCAQMGVFLYEKVWSVLIGGLGYLYLSPFMSRGANGYSLGRMGIVECIFVGQPTNTTNERSQWPTC